jgi:hypothetical protein
MRRGGLAVGALLCVFLTGCVFGEFGRVCTTIGYISTLRVELVGDVSDVVSVRLCDADDVCSVTEAESSSPTSPSPSTSAAPESVPQYVVRHDGGRTWTVEMPFGVPDDVVISVLRSDGSIAGENHAALDWKRVGGSEECGGPLEAGPITLDLSAPVP